jgi:hypothetical protein
MKWFLRIAVLNLLVALVGLGLYWSGQTSLPKGASIKDAGKVLAVEIARRKNPDLSPEQIQRIYDSTPGGLDGLSHALKGADQQRIDTLNALVDGNSAAEEVDPAAASAPKREKPPQHATRSGGIDPNVLASIQRMAIPDSMKREMIQRYIQQGAAPKLAASAAAAPLPGTSETGSEPPKTDLSQENARLRQELAALKALQGESTGESAQARAELVRKAQDSVKAIQEAQKARDRQLSSSAGP